MRTKLKSVNRGDGFVWLAVEFTVGRTTKRIYLHRQAPFGHCIRPGQRWKGR